MEDSILTIISKAALEDSEIKEALLEYIKAATAKPKEEWREIWYYHSEVSRHMINYINVDRLTGQIIEGGRPVWLRMKAEYCDTRQVVKVTAFMIGCDKDSFRLYWGNVFSSENPILVDTNIVHDYAEGIEWAQENWGKAFGKFIVLTKTIPQDNNNE